MEESNFKISIEECDKHYLNGKYPDYKVSLAKIVDVEELRNSKSKNLSTQSLILKNNLLVAECLEIKWNEDAPRKMWAELLLEFSTLYHQCTNMEVKILAHECCLWLNVLHNYLFLTWIMPKDITDKKNKYTETIPLVIKCFKLILDTYNKPCLSLENLRNELHVLNLMKLSCTHNILFSTDGPHNIGVQLFEVYFLTSQIVIESLDGSSEHLVKDVLKYYVDFLEMAINLRPSFEFSEVVGQDNTANNTYTTLFKLGLHKANSQVGDFNTDTLSSALCFTYSLCFLKLKEYKSCLVALRNTHENGSKPSFLLNYFKAYVYFRLGDFQTSCYFISKTFGLSLDSVMRARRGLLYGLILSERGEFLKAQNEFRIIQEIDSFLPLALYYSAVNYQSYALSQIHDGEVSIHVKTLPVDQRKRLRMNLSAVELPIVALKALVLSLKHSTKRNLKPTSDFISVDNRLLSILHPQPEITESHAIYLLAKELVMVKKFSESADKFLYLLTVPHHCHSQPVGLIESPPVPLIHTLMNETVAVLIQDKRWLDADIVCKQALSSCKNRGESLIPHMLQAHIEKQKGMENDTLEILSNCLNSVSQWATENASETMQNENMKEIGDRLAAKACVQIGFIYIERHLPRVAEKHLKRALCYNKKDKDALYHLIMVLKNNVTASHALWDEHNTTFKNVDKQYTNIALNFLLQTQVTNEQVEQLSVNFLISDPIFLDEFNESDND